MDEALEGVRVVQGSFTLEADLSLEAGARVALTYQGDRLKGRVESLASSLDGALTLPCDATDDEQASTLRVGKARDSRAQRDQR